jgi:hypothetical protein
MTVSIAVGLQVGTDCTHSGYATVDFARIWSELPDGLQAFEAFEQAVGRHLGPKQG